MAIKWVSIIHFIRFQQQSFSPNAISLLFDFPLWAIIYNFFLLHSALSKVDFLVCFARSSDPPCCLEWVNGHEDWKRAVRDNYVVTYKGGNFKCFIKRKLFIFNYDLQPASVKRHSNDSWKAWKIESRFMLKILS